MTALADKTLWSQERPESVFVQVPWTVAAACEEATLDAARRNEGTRIVQVYFQGDAEQRKKRREMDIALRRIPSSLTNIEQGMQSVELSFVATKHDCVRAGQRKRDGVLGGEV